MKFRPEQHIPGKVYDLTQENMNAMLAEIERLKEKLDIAVDAMVDSIAQADDYGDSHNSKPIRKAIFKIRGNIND